MSSLDEPARPRPAGRAPRSTRDVLLQAALLAVCLGFAGLVASTAASNIAQRGIPVGFGFLFDPAGFSVAETLLPYDPANSNLWAVVVGVGNTLFVSGLVAFGSTCLGAALAVGRMSGNPLISGLAPIWIEGVRNVPPILLLIFLYTMWWKVFPSGDVVQMAPGVLGSIRGIAVPTLVGPWYVGPVLLAALVGALALIGRAVVAGGAVFKTPAAYGWLALVAGAGLTLAAAHVTLSVPAPNGQDIVGGLSLTPELFTIVFGLTLYTTGFIAEILRGGLEAVPRGQWEAARALGLARSDILRRVVMPQMMQVVIPPMTSQYINIIKNSTLALAIGYSEFMTIMGTMINKTNHAVEGTTVIIVVYLLINLGAALLLDRYNRRVARLER